MYLKNKGAEFFIPDLSPVDEAISKSTHMAIGAHQDDLEIMAYHGISQCFRKADKSFFGIVVTNGAGSARSNLYKDYSDEEMCWVRKQEQKKAAYAGEYGALAMLDYTSEEARDPKNPHIVSELKMLISAAKPKAIYTHNLADRHDTHVSVAVRAIQALRELPKEFHPHEFIGCEVWRSLDWLKDEDKVVLDVGQHPNIAAALIGVYDSQIAGGKRYDLATSGRWMANATYDKSHKLDKSSALVYGMDLKPLLDNANLDIREYTKGYINRFAMDVWGRLESLI